MQNQDGTKITIERLLSRDAEREKIFAEAIESFNEFADRIGGNDAVEAQIKSLAARWQATTGATGAEGQG